MKYEIQINHPGIAGFEKKTGYPIAHPPTVVEFEAVCNTEAFVFAGKYFRDSTHSNVAGTTFNVSKA